MKPLPHLNTQNNEKDIIKTQPTHYHISIKIQHFAALHSVKDTDKIIYTNIFIMNYIFFNLVLSHDSSYIWYEKNCVVGPTF